MDKENQLKVAVAADIAGVTRATIINWIRVYGIGWRVGGQWRVDREKLEKVLNGTQQTPGGKTAR